MTSQKVSQEAREWVAQFGRAQEWLEEDVTAVLDGHRDLSDLVQAFAKFETQIRNAILEEAAGVLKRARDEIERLEYPYIGESAASVIADIDASIRQLGERGR